MTGNCILIDYAAGECWEMPFELYEKYRVEVVNLVQGSLSVVQSWLATLTEEEREMISRK